MKGISLLMDQFSALVAILPQIETIAKEKGEHIPRPDYQAPPTGSPSNGEERDTVEGSRGKENFEATSEEDEG